MRWFTFILILAAATLANAANVLNYIAIGPLNVRPDLMIIILVFFALNSTPRNAIITSFLIGFAADISTPDSIGLYMTCFGAIGSVASLMNRQWFALKPIAQFLIIFITAIAIYALASQLKTLNRQGDAIEPFYYLCWHSLYTALAGPIIWYILELIAPIFGIERFRISSV